MRDDGIVIQYLLGLLGKFDHCGVFLFGGLDCNTVADNAGENGCCCCVMHNILKFIDSLDMFEIFISDLLKPLYMRKIYPKLISTSNNLMLIKLPRMCI